MEASLGKIGKLGKVGSMRSTIPPIVRAGAGGQKQRTASPPDAVDALLARMDSTDRRLGKRLLSLSQRFAGGSLPEWITYDWLDRNQVDFSYQVELYGGRMRRGGLLPDFVVYGGGAAMAWRIQGEYWHTRADKRQRDFDEVARLLGQYVQGARIEQVVDLWESDVYRRRPWIYQLAMLGSGMRV